MTTSERQTRALEAADEALKLSAPFVSCRLQVSVQSAHCQLVEQHPIERNQLDQVITCPSAGCETQLRINPFVLASPERTRRLWGRR